MSGLEFFAYPGAGEWARDNVGYMQAVRVGDRIEISGQGGWDHKLTHVDISTDLATEIAQAFENVDVTLRHAGGKGWEQVYKIKTFHTEITPEVTKLITAQAAKWMPNHKPIWTQVGVKQLGLPEMHFELEVVAYDPKN